MPCQHKCLRSVFLALLVAFADGLLSKNHFSLQSCNPSASLYVSVTPDQTVTSHQFDTIVPTRTFKQQIASSFIHALLGSPVFGLLVNKGRDMMKGTAIKEGIPWDDYCNRMLNQKPNNWNNEVEEIISENRNVTYPAYFTRKFHGYSEGNLCMQAAVEQDIAFQAVAIRNFPEEGLNASMHFRTVFEDALKSLGGLSIPVGGTVLDVGCGCGSSTRRLAALTPQASRIIGKKSFLYSTFSN